MPAPVVAVRDVARGVEPFGDVVVVVVRGAAAQARAAPARAPERITGRDTGVDRDSSADPAAAGIAAPKSLHAELAHEYEPSEVAVPGKYTKW